MRKVPIDGPIDCQSLVVLLVGWAVALFVTLT